MLIRRVVVVQFVGLTMTHILLNVLFVVPSGVFLFNKAFCRRFVALLVTIGIKVVQHFVEITVFTLRFH